MIYTCSTPKPLLKVEVHRPHAHTDARDLVAALEHDLFNISCVAGSAHLTVLTGGIDCLDEVRHIIEMHKAGPKTVDINTL
jgi:hypothetical protein